MIKRQSFRLARSSATAVLSAASFAMLIVPVLFADDAKPGQKNPEELFRELDKNGDGKLSAGEVSDEQRKFFDHLLRVADNDKSGELTKDEFLKGFKPDDAPRVNPQDFGGGGGGGNPAERFKRLDANKDGKLTLDELPEQAKERLKPMFERLGKTELTQEDFVKAAAERGKGGGGAAGGGGGDPAERFKQLDANKDGKLTLDELPEQAKERLKPLFERLGKTELTQEDFAKAAAQMGKGGGGGTAGGGNPAEMFKRLDANKDGKLTLDELPDQAKERLKPLFERLGKTELTQEDFAKAAAQMGKGGGGGAGGGGNPAEMFKRFDGNKDGKLTLDELPDQAKERFKPLFTRLGKTELTQEDFAKAAAERGKAGGGPGVGGGGGNPAEMFKRLDANNDGKLTLDELPEQAKQRLKPLFERLGKSELTREDLAKAAAERGKPGG